MSAQKGFVIWFTGLPSSGKTTLARVVTERLKSFGVKVELLDGDEVRRSLSPDLGFSKKDRETHAQRVAYLCKLLSRNGIVPVVSLISPYRSSRRQAREQVGDGFVEVWAKCSLEACMQRDVKGLYKKALAGEITDMTGLQDPYEDPAGNEITVDTEHGTVEKCSAEILRYLAARNYLKVPQPV